MNDKIMSKFRPVTTPHLKLPRQRLKCLQCQMRFIVDFRTKEGFNKLGRFFWAIKCPRCSLMDNVLISE